MLRVTRDCSDLLERWNYIAFSEKIDGAGYGPLVPCDLVRLAAQTGPQSRRPRRFSIREKSHIPPRRVTRRTGWAAIDSGGQHAGDEPAIKAAIPPQNGRPSLIAIPVKVQGHFHVHMRDMATFNGVDIPKLAIKDSDSSCIAAHALLTGPRNMRGRPKGAPFSAWITSKGDDSSVEHSGGIQASLSGRYATALFELARDAKQIDAVSASLGQIKAALGESEEFRRLISSPLVSRDEAMNAVAAAATVLKIDDLSAKFLGTLASNRRLGQLSAVIRAFGLLAARHRGETTAVVTSAHPLDDDQITSLKAKLKSELKQDVALDLNVDPDILGGLIVKVGSRQIDGSIRTKLNSLAKAMKG